MIYQISLMNNKLGSYFINSKKWNLIIQLKYNKKLTFHIYLLSHIKFISISQLFIRKLREWK